MLKKTKNTKKGTCPDCDVRRCATPVWHGDTRTRNAERFAVICLLTDDLDNCTSHRCLRHGDTRTAERFALTCRLIDALDNCPSHRCFRRDYLVWRFKRVNRVELRRLTMLWSATESVPVRSIGTEPLVKQIWCARKGAAHAKKSMVPGSKVSSSSTSYHMVEIEVRDVLQAPKREKKIACIHTYTRHSSNRCRGSIHVYTISCGTQQ